MTFITLKYDPLVNRIENIKKRLHDLAKRKSHAGHETQIAFAELINLYIEVPRRRVILFFYTAHALSTAQWEHRECCPEIQNENI